MAYFVMGRMDDSSSLSRRPPSVLLVEDNPGDARLAKEAFSEVDVAGELHVVSSGDEALEYVHQRGEYTDTPKPDLVLLDWHLPGTSGEEVLTELKDNQNLKHIPIIVVTGSQAEGEIVKSYANRANACIPKPSNPDELMDTVHVVEQFWLEVARLPNPDEENEEHGVR